MRTARNVAACAASSTAKRKASRQEYVFMHLICGMGHYEAAERIGRAAETCWRYRRELLADPGALFMALVTYLGPAGAWAATRELVAKGFPATEPCVLAVA